MTKQFQAQFRVTHSETGPATNWLLYPSGRNPMDRMKEELDEGDMLLVDSIEDLLMHIREDTHELCDFIFHRPNQFMVATDRNRLSFKLAMPIGDMPARWNPHIEVRMVEFDPDEKTETLQDKVEALKKHIQEGI